ncbi:ribonuclease HI family protein [Candidatus Saccharibacteria bacterium]|nr:ribonuclease HI family protein [Candidatus Saccharibacteria bacterium]
MKYDLLNVYCDGGSRGNPGPAAAGVVFTTPKGEVIASYNLFLGEKTNNFAEYSAVLLALDKLGENPAKKYDFYLDSELVTKQLNGQYRVKHADMKELFERVQIELKDVNASFTHVLRAKNKLADEQVNICLDEQDLGWGAGNK